VIRDEEAQVTSVENPGSERMLHRDDAEGDERRSSAGAPGVLAVIAAALFAAVHVAAIVVGVGGDYRTATILAWVAIVGTALTLVMGVVAFVRGRGRGWSAVAVAVSIVANPLILTRILVFFEGLQS
jgi:hypothetical protein